MRRPYNFQKTGVAFLLGARRRVLLADDMGLGKTAQALRASAAFARVRVVCPGFLRPVWQAEIKKDRLDAGRFDIRSYENATKNADDLRRDKCDVLIIDEAHYLKSPDAARTRALIGLGGIHAAADRVWLLTGTPALNNAAELYTLAVLCAPRACERAGAATYSRWCGKFCSVTAGYRNAFTPRGVRNEKLLSSILGKFMLRRLKSEVLPDLPEKTITLVDIEPSKDLTRLIIEENRIVKADPGAYRELIAVMSRAANPFDLTPLATVRKDFGLGKLPLIAPHLLNDLEQTDKIAVFAWHRDVINSLPDLLPGTECVKLHGGMSVKVRAANAEAFQHGTPRVLVAQMQAAGSGYTFTAASLAYFLEAWTVPNVLAQCEDRLLRIGQENAVSIKRFRVPGSLDARLWASAERKRKDLLKIL